jgi:hypothetical protein
VLKRTELFLTLIATGLWLSCSCEPTSAEQQRFACSVSEECAAGFICSPSFECVRPPDGGGAASGGGDAGPDAGFDAGREDAGPLSLAFTTSAQTIATGSCSAPVSFQVRRGPAAAALELATPVSLAADPPGLTLFSGSGCTTPGTQTTLAPGSNSGSFSFRAGDAGSFTLSLSSPAFLGATQSATVSPPQAPSALGFGGGTAPARSGECSGPIPVELRDLGGIPRPSSAATVVALSSTPSPGINFFSDSSCITPITSLTLPAGSASVGVFVSRDTAMTYSLTAMSPGLSTGTRSFVVLPMVRTGTCVVAGGSGMTACAVNPPVLSLNDSFLVYQVGSASEVAGSATVRCELDAVDSITCHRASTNLDALISWQVAEVKGATVRKVEAICDGGAPSLPLVPPAPAASTFLLTAQFNDGQLVNENDFNIARLNAAGSSVDFDFGFCTGNVGSLMAQVVTLPNISVDRGNTSIAADGSSANVSAAPAPASGVLLAQWQVPVLGQSGICDLTLRPELSGPNVHFSRGVDAGGFCTAPALGNIAWERVDFKATAAVQQLTISMNATVDTITANLNPVDRTRTLLFTGAGGALGQGLGESNYPGNPDGLDFFGEVSAALTLRGSSYQATGLQAKRESKLGASQWTVYVVELRP